MNKIKSIILFITLGLSVTSCVDVLDDNKNPDRAPEITAATGLSTVVFYAQQTVYDHAEYNIYLSQCLTGSVKSSIGTYSYKSEWEFITMNRHPQWRRHYYELGVNLKNLIANSQKIKSPNYELIARTIRLMSTQLTTDMFGDMPLSQAYLSNSPAYDTQASIYKWMLQEADDLISLYEDDAWINSPTNQIITIAQDRVYGGDLSKWKGLVYAIKARILLRNIPNVDASGAMCQEIFNTAQKAIDQWRTSGSLYGSWFGSEPRYNFTGGVKEQNCVWSDAQPAVVTSFEISRKNLLDKAMPSKFFLVDCLGLLNTDKPVQSGMYVSRQGFANDPRASLLMLARKGPATASEEGSSPYKLRYLENNIGMSSVSSLYELKHFPNLFSGAYAGSKLGTGYNPIFTMEELYFIQAEAKYWSGDKVTACNLAKEATQNNIQRHVDWFLATYPNKDPGTTNKIYPGGVTTGDAIVYEQERWWKAQVQIFLDNKSEESTSSIPPVDTRGNKRWFFNESEYTLSDLMMQKYISMYMQPEQWSDLRRYHYSNNRNNYRINNEIVYPKLRRPYNLYAPAWVNGLSESEKEVTWIQRVNYDPETEDLYNKAELERLGAYKNYNWLKKPMIWAQESGERSSLTAE